MSKETKQPVHTNKIYNESCLDTMSRMPDDFIDLTVTSPPYDNLRTYNNDIDKTWGEHIWKPILQELYRVTKEGGVVVWVVGDATIKGSETGTSFKQALYAMECGFNLHDTMIYNKGFTPCYDPRNKRCKHRFEYMFIFSKGDPNTYNPIKDQPVKNKGIKKGSTARKPNGNIRKFKDVNLKDFQDRSNIWEVQNGYMKTTKDKYAYKHPAMFPEKLAYDHIHYWSNENDLVYDPFMGSGTTAKMAKFANRNYIGSEISEEYVKLAKKRIDQMPETLF